MASGELTGNRKGLVSEEMGGLGKARLSLASPQDRLVATVDGLAFASSGSLSERLYSVSEQLSEPHKEDGSVEAACESDWV